MSFLLPGGGGTGTPYHAGFNTTAGNWYATTISNKNTTFAVSSSTIYFSPFYVPTTTAFTKMSGEVTTIGAAGCKCRIGVYSNDPNTGYPNALLLDAGEFAGDAVAQNTIVVSLSLTPGMYWLALVSSATPTLRADSVFPRGTFQLASITTGTIIGWTASFTYTPGTALPSSAPALTALATATLPRVALAVA